MVKSIDLSPKHSDTVADLSNKLFNCQSLTTQLLFTLVKKVGNETDHRIKKFENVIIETQKRVDEYEDAHKKFTEILSARRPIEDIGYPSSSSKTPPACSCSRSQLPYPKRGKGFGKPQNATSDPYPVVDVVSYGDTVEDIDDANLEKELQKLQ